MISLSRNTQLDWASLVLGVEDTPKDCWQNGNKRRICCWFALEGPCSRILSLPCSLPMGSCQRLHTASHLPPPALGRTEAVELWLLHSVAELWSVSPGQHHLALEQTLSPSLPPWEFQCRPFSLPSQCLDSGDVAVGSRPWLDSLDLQQTDLLHSSALTFGGII